jgi:hypothetical protein
VQLVSTGDVANGFLTLQQGSMPAVALTPPYSIFSGAPLTAARSAEPPAVVKSILPVTNAAMPVLVRMTMISAVNPSRLKKPSFAAKCTGQETRPGDDEDMQIFS